MLSLSLPDLSDNMDDETEGDETQISFRPIASLRSGVTHKTYHWVRVAVGEERVPLSPEVVVREHGLPKNVVLQYLREQIYVERAVRGLPFAFGLIILYVLMILNHTQAHIVRGNEVAIHFDIEENANFAFSAYFGHKNYQDVNNFADFWSWLRLGFIPLYANRYHPISEGLESTLDTLTTDERNTYLWHNRKIGPILLAQSTAEAVSCPDEEISNRFAVRCTENTPNIELSLNPTEAEVSASAMELELNWMQWLNGSEAQLQELERMQWIGPNTLRAQVSFIVYNGPTDCLTQTNVQFLFARTGRIWKDITHRSFIFGVSLEQLIFMSMFYLQITSIFLKELFDMMALLFRYRCNLAATMREYAGIWNIVDWVSIIVAYALLWMWMLDRQNVGSFQDHVLELRTSDENQQTNQAKFVTLFTDLEQIGASHRRTRLLGAMYPLIIMLRLFKAFSAQPRLALISNLFSLSFKDLSHFGIIFVSVFMTYAAMGVVCFGLEDHDFATLDRSIVTCFRALMMDLEVDELAESGRFWPTAFFFISFMCVMAMVLLNMLIAIFIDVFPEVKASAISSETLLQQVCDIVQRRVSILLGKSLRHSRILKQYRKSLVQEDLAGVIFVKDFCESVPGLSESQAFAELLDCAEAWARKNTETIQLTDIVKVGNLVAKEAVGIRSELQRSKQTFKDAISSIDKELDHLKDVQADFYNRYLVDIPEGSTRTFLLLNEACHKFNLEDELTYYQPVPDSPTARGVYTVRELQC